MKRIRVALTALLVGGFMFATPSPAFAEQAFAEVTCAKGDGEERTFFIGWDNSDPFFEGKGDIPRLYCEGGYSQPYNFYVSDNLPADSPLRWYNGIAPELEPAPEVVEPEPVESIEPEPVPSVVESLNPEPTEPTQTESPEPTPEPIESTQPTVTPTPEPKPTPTPKVSQIAPVPLVEPSPTASNLAPNLKLSPPPEVVQEVVQESEQIVVLEVPTALANIVGIAQIFAAAEAFMNIGSDMTDEEREESQSVVVAAVIVGQIAMRKTK
jgi:hypothetical protein